MSDHGRFGGPRFAQLDDDYKVWAAYQRAQLKKEKLWKAVVTDRPASGSDDKKADPVVEEWDAMNEAALATIQMSVKPVHLNTVTSVDTAKEAWNALKGMFEARDNAQLLRLMEELSSLKKGDDESIIKFTSRAKMIRDELAMLGTPVDDNTLALRVSSGLPSEYGMLRTVLEKKDVKLVMSDVTAQLLQVEQRNMSAGSSKPVGSVKSQAFAAAAPKKPFDKKSIVCYYCDKKGHMKRECYKRRLTRPRANTSPVAAAVMEAMGAGPRRVPLWHTLLRPVNPAPARLTGAQAGRRPGCLTPVRPATWAPGTRASPSRRRGAGPRSPWPTVTKSPSRGTATSLWTLARATPRRAWS